MRYNPHTYATHQEAERLVSAWCMFYVLSDIKAAGVGE